MKMAYDTSASELSPCLNSILCALSLVQAFWTIKSLNCPFKGDFLSVDESEMAVTFESAGIELTTQYAQFADQFAFSMRSATKKAMDFKPPHYSEFPLPWKSSQQLRDYAYLMPSPCRRPYNHSPLHIIPCWCILSLPSNMEFTKEPGQQVALGSAPFLMPLLDSQFSGALVCFNSFGIEDVKSLLGLEFALVEPAFVVGVVFLQCHSKAIRKFCFPLAQVVAAQRSQEAK